MTQLDLTDPLTTEKKIDLTLSQLVPKIIEPKVGIPFLSKLPLDHF